MTTTPKSRTIDLSTPLVACIDGPMLNQWFTQSEWDARCEAAEYMLGKGQRQAACLAYVPTKRTVNHPTNDGRVGAEMRFDERLMVARPEPATVEAQPYPKDPCVVSLGPRGGLRVTCPCGAVTPVNRNRDAWTCTGCGATRHGGTWPPPEELAAELDQAS